MYVNIVGNCVTGIGSDEVCGLSSTSTGCSATNNFTAVNCLCYPGVNNSDNCQGTWNIYYYTFHACCNYFPTELAELTCPEGSDYIPMCSEAFPVCLPSNRVCDRRADCNAAADEIPSFCGNSKLDNAQLLSLRKACSESKIQNSEVLFIPKLKLSQTYRKCENGW